MRFVSIETSDGRRIHFPVRRLVAMEVKPRSGARGRKASTKTLSIRVEGCPEGIEVTGSPIEVAKVERRIRIELENAPD